MENIVNLVWSHSAEWHASFGGAGLTREKTTTWVSWKKLTWPLLKLNTDGAIRHGIGARCVGLIRNSSGSWIVGFSRHIGFTSRIAAELWGLREGLALAAEC